MFLFFLDLAVTSANMHGVFLYSREVSFCNSYTNMEVYYSFTSLSLFYN